MSAIRPDRNIGEESKPIIPGKTPIEEKSAITGAVARARISLSISGERSRLHSQAKELKTEDFLVSYNREMHTLYNNLQQAKKSLEQAKKGPDYEKAKLEYEETTRGIRENVMKLLIDGHVGGKINLKQVEETLKTLADELGTDKAGLLKKYLGEFSTRLADVKDGLATTERHINGLIKELKAVKENFKVRTVQNASIPELRELLQNYERARKDLHEKFTLLKKDVLTQLAGEEEVKPTLQRLAELEANLWEVEEEFNKERAHTDRALGAIQEKFDLPMRRVDLLGRKADLQRARQMSSVSISDDVKKKVVQNIFNRLEKDLEQIRNPTVATMATKTESAITPTLVQSEKPLMALKNRIVTFVKDLFAKARSFFEPKKELKFSLNDKVFTIQKSGESIKETVSSALKAVKEQDLAKAAEFADFADIHARSAEKKLEEFVAQEANVDFDQLYLDQEQFAAFEEFAKGKQVGGLDQFRLLKEMEKSVEKFNLDPFKQNITDLLKVVKEETKAVIGNWRQQDDVFRAHRPQPGESQKIFFQRQERGRELVRNIKEKFDDTELRAAYREWIKTKPEIMEARQASEQARKDADSVRKFKTKPRGN